MNEEEKEEFDVLLAIYGKDFIEYKKQKVLFYIGKYIETNISQFVTKDENIKLDERFSDLRISFLSEDYPKSIPSVEFKGHLWKNMNIESFFEEKLIGMFQQGQPILFTWICDIIEYVREFVPAFFAIAEENIRDDHYVEVVKEDFVPIPFAESDPIVDRKSIFIGFASEISKPDQVPKVIKSIEAAKGNVIRRATHVMFAYRIQQSNIVKQDYDDDGENGAASDFFICLNKSTVQILWLL